MTAASVPPSPRERRVRSDNELLRQLVANSDLIHFEVPPEPRAERFVLLYTCRGVAACDTAGQPIYSEHHRITLDLPSDYPISKPSAQVTTPLLHPNIDGRVCIDWEPAMGLDEFCIILGHMLQYRIYNLNSPLSRPGYTWAESHTALLPVDTRPLRRGAHEEAVAQPAIRIRIHS